MSRKRHPYRQELDIARSQRKRLQTMINKLTDMAIEWDGVSGAMECDFNMQAEELQAQLSELDAQIKEWSAGVGDGREFDG